MSYRLQSEQEDHHLFSKICDTIILSVLQLIMVFVPLFFLVKNEEVFEFNKMIFTYLSVTVIVTTWVIKSLLEKKITFKKTPFDWFILFFLLSQLISTALSIHPRTSLFGYYTRFHGGLYSTISYLIIFYATATFVTKKRITGFIGCILIGAFLAGLYAFPEHFGHSPSCLLLTGELNASCWIQDVQSRVFGTFGQPNWLAAYLVLLLPLSAAVSFFDSEKKEKTMSVIEYGKKKIGLFLAFLFFATLLFTKSRSGFLGFTAGWALFIPYLILEQFREKKLQVSKSIVTIILIAIVAGTALVFGTPFTPAISQLISKKATTEQTTAAPVMVDRLEAGGTDSGDIRRIVWKGAIDVWKRYPIFGSGVETFAYSYYRDRPMEHNNVSEWDFLYNKAHNEELNFLATTGAVGLFSYLLLLTVTGWFLFKEALFSAEKNTRLLSAAILAGLIGLHISNFFGFSTVMVTILMYALPTLVINQIGDDKEVQWSIFSLKPASVKTNFSGSKLFKPIANFLSKFPPGSSQNKKVGAGQWVMVSIASMIGLFFFIQVSTIWFADHYYSQAKDSYTADDYNTALKKLQLAIELSPKEALYYELYSKVASQYAIAALQENQNEVGTQFANSAIEASDVSLKLNPVHLNFYKTRNQVLVTLALARPSLYDDAIHTLDVARTLSPTDAKLVYYSALVKNAKDDVAGAKVDLNRSIEMKPNYDSARYLLGQLLENEKNYDGAKEQYQYILDNIAPDNPQVKERMAAIATMSAVSKKK